VLAKLSSRGESTFRSRRRVDRRHESRSDARCHSTLHVASAGLPRLGSSRQYIVPLVPQTGRGSPTCESCWERGGASHVSVPSSSGFGGSRRHPPLSGAIGVILGVFLAEPPTTRWPSTSLYCPISPTCLRAPMASNLSRGRAPRLPGADRGRARRADRRRAIRALREEDDRAKRAPDRAHVMSTKAGDVSLGVPKLRKEASSPPSSSLADGSTRRFMR